METGTRSLRNVFRNGSCNDCPLAIIYLLVMPSNSLVELCRLMPLPCSCTTADGHHPVTAAMPQFSTAMFPSKLPLIQYAAASVSRKPRCARPSRVVHHTGCREQNVATARSIWSAAAESRELYHW